MVARSRLVRIPEVSLCHENAFLMSLFRTAQTVVDGGATPQTRNADRIAGAAGSSRRLASVACALSWYVTAYLDPDHVRANIRRGRIALLKAEMTSPGADDG
jgi:hypothetical protein